MPKRNIVARTHPRPQSLRFFWSSGRRNVNDILRRVALGTRIARTWQNNYNTMQHLQMLHEKSDHFQISANNSQHVATRRHRVAKRRQHVHPTMLWYVALKCCDRLVGTLQVCLFTCHWIGLRALYKRFVKKSSLLTYILDTKVCFKEQICFRVLQIRSECLQGSNKVEN